MSSVRFGEVEQLLSSTGVAGAALFLKGALLWSRIADLSDEVARLVGSEILALWHEYHEVGRVVEELYFCFHSTAWLAVVWDEHLLLIQLENGAPLGRVVRVARRFLNASEFPRQIQFSSTPDLIP